MPTLISVRCTHCQLEGLVAPHYSQLWLIRYGTGYCQQCQRFHHVPWPEKALPHCHLHPDQRLSPWQLSDPCPRCGGDLREAPNELRIDLSVS
jgi:hypothetical protein